ncbi:MAG TPA: hypothetical protein VJZ76_17420 [Thermoanaerobaculia bacterium]|nr:hypothetical protein [Thermoanaerobaculia bacterium]
MSDDNFLERLRGDARQLRYEPGDFAFVRLQARVRERLTQPTAAQFLASWFRPISASLAAMALVAALGTAYYVDDTRDQVTMDSMASNSVEITVDGATYSVD